MIGLLGQPPEGVLTVPTQFDVTTPFKAQVRDLVGRVPLTAPQWQSTPILINPPSLASIIAVLLAELHGRCGDFPPIIRLRPVPGALPPRFEVAEILDLQAIRETARQTRTEPR